MGPQLPILTRFLDRLRRAFGRYGNARREYGGGLQRLGVDVFAGWVNVATTVRAEAIAATELVLYERQGRARTLKEYRGDGHWFESILEEPNPYQTWYEIAHCASTLYDWYGNAFLWWPRDGWLRLPMQLWVLPNEAVTVDAAAYGIPGQYWMRGATEEPLAADEVVHLRRNQPRPASTGVLGTGRIDAILDAIELEQTSIRSLRRYYENDALPPVAIRVAGEVDEARAARIRAAWLERHAGVERRSQIGVVGSGTEVVTLSPDMSRLQGAVSIEEICLRRISSAFRVPIGKITGEYNSRAPATSYDMMQYQFLMDGIDPWMRYVTAELTKFLRRDRSSRSMMVRHRDFTLRDASLQLQRDRFEIAEGIVSHNEYRSGRGMEVVAGGDVRMVPAGRRAVEGEKREGERVGREEVLRVVEGAVARRGKRIMNDE
jgi:HK97 family phage portal protein